MNKKVIFLVFVLFLLLHLPKKASDSIRSFTVASLFPAWQGAISMKHYLLDRPIGRKKLCHSEELSQLELENQILRSQVESVYEAKFAGAAAESFSAVAARVIYRDPSSWSSSLWINAGREDSEIIEKNSPVVVGGSLIGVIDYVGKRQSRVRLITDSGVSPAVRVARGKIQNQHLALQLQSVSELLQKREDLFVSEEERGSFQKMLTALEKRLEKEESTLHLAKGELEGSSAPLWRSRRPLLKGIGFNFEVVGEGEKRPEKVLILREGDLLVTSGLDGVFPPGLTVANVFSVKEAGYMYELTARPTVRNFNGFEVVQVLPAIRNE